MGRTMSTRAAVAVVAAVVFVVALLVGFWSHSIPLGFEAGADQATTMSCGSAFDSDTGDAGLIAAESGLVAAISGGDVAVTEQELVGQCEAAVSTPRLVGFVLGGAAVLVLLFVWLTGQHQTRWDVEEEGVDEAAT